MTDLPDWAMKKARERLDYLDHCSCDECTADMATALHHAYQQGKHDGQREMQERAAKVADEAQALRERLYAENQAGINAYKAVQAEEIASAIRSLSPSQPEAKGAREDG